MNIIAVAIPATVFTIIITHIVTTMMKARTDYGDYDYSCYCHFLLLLLLLPQAEYSTCICTCIYTYAVHMYIYIYACIYVYLQNSILCKRIHTCTCHRVDSDRSERLGFAAVGDRDGSLGLSKVGGRLRPRSLGLVVPKSVL